MKKLFYLSTFSLPNRRAHGVQVVKTCEALSESFNVTLFVGRIRGNAEDIYKYYLVYDKFDIKATGAFRGRFKILSDFISAIRFSKVMKKNPNAIFYTRDHKVAFSLLFLNRNFFYEIHSLPPRSLYFMRLIAKKCKGVISTNQYKKDYMIKNWEINENKILVAPNGVSEEMFEGVKEKQEELREKLSLPKDRKLVGFIGRFEERGNDKGVRFVLEMLKDRKFDNTTFCFVGGTKEEVEKFRELVEEFNIDQEAVILKGAVEFQEVPYYIKAFDLLILIHKKTEHLMYVASPVKLFEYMASLRPAVVPDMPAIKEIVGEKEVFFYEPENIESFYQALRQVFENADEANRRAGAAFELSKNFNWSKRAEKIKDFALSKL